MKRIVLVMSLFFIVGSTTEAYSQGWLEKLGKKAVEKAKSKTEQKVEEKVDKAFDKTEGAVKGKANQNPSQKGVTTVNGNEDAEAGANVSQKGQSLEMIYAKSDFVPGDEIIFEDLLIGEKLGEFPSMWDLKKGNAEVANVGGENAIHIERETMIMPYMKEKNYLPDVFTIEFDLYVPCRKSNGGKDNCQDNNAYNLNLVNAEDQNLFQMEWYNSTNNWEKNTRIDWNWLNERDRSVGEADFMFKLSDFNHVSISFNKRALKFYINGVRVVNIPRCNAPSRFQLFSYQGDAKDERFIKNVRIAKGAVPLYDRIMSDGKFISYGIMFDVGKSIIKPESMGEINRIVKLMTDNPDLKFSVEGHTDATGKAASNQTLSEARSKAIVDKLVELGIASNRFTAVGKGQNQPIADNSTSEGRAKNRRVEFVKI